MIGKPPDGEWLSIRALGRRLGVSKNKIQRRVDELVGVGRLETRPGPQGAKLVDLVAFEAADKPLEPDQGVPGCAQGGPRGRRSQPMTLVQEQARRTAAQASIAEIALAERRGKLMSIDEVIAATAKCSETIVRSLDHLSSAAIVEELVSAVRKEGAVGARRHMKAVVEHVRGRISTALAKAAAEDGIRSQASEGE